MTHIPGRFTHSAITVIAVMLLAPTASAQNIPAASAKAFIVPPASPLTSVQSWARNGEMFSVWQGETKDVPYDAAKIKVRLMIFTDGLAVREIVLEKGQRTHPHEGFEEAVFYQAEGRRVQVVGEHSSESDPGDVSLHARGVIHSTIALTDNRFIEFVYKGRNLPDPKATWLRPSDGTAAAPAKGVTAQQYALPGYSFTRYRMAAGSTLAGTGGAGDSLFYVLGGRLDARIGTETAAAPAGSAMRVRANGAFSMKSSGETILLRATAARPDPTGG